MLCVALTSSRLAGIVPVAFTAAAADVFAGLEDDAAPFFICRAASRAYRGIATVCTFHELLMKFFLAINIISGSNRLNYLQTNSPRPTLPARAQPALMQSNFSRPEAAARNYLTTAYVSVEILTENPRLWLWSRARAHEARLSFFKPVTANSSGIVANKSSQASLKGSPGSDYACALISSSLACPLPVRWLARVIQSQRSAGTWQARAR